MGSSHISSTTSDGRLLEATIDSAGAQLMSIKLDGKEYLWQGDEKFWPRRAPVLFPIVGCLRGDHAKSAQGDVNLKRHGIARLYEHAVAEKTEDSVTFELSSSTETKAAYPFDFKLNMTYSLDGGKLNQTFKVTNTGSVDLPFTLGGHPAFNVEGGFEEWKLVFPEAWTASVPAIDEAGIHDFGKMAPVFEDSDELQLSHDLIDRLLTIVFLDVPGRSVKLLGPEGHGVEVDFRGFDFLGVWTASHDAPFVAIEPWIGCADAVDESGVFEEKRGTVVLAPGEARAWTFSIRPF